MITNVLCFGDLCPSLDAGKGLCAYTAHTAFMAVAAVAAGTLYCRVLSIITLCGHVVMDCYTEIPTLYDHCMLCV